MTKYISTRGDKREITGAEATITGLAGDRGLYVPKEIPKLPMEISEMLDMPYKQVAFHIIKSFFDDFTDEELKFCIDGAYDKKFDKAEIVPLVQAGTGHILELFHGKTAAFKDMALSILPYLMTTALKKHDINKKVCILTATSGDTGKAALEGFADVEGTEIIVFYPHKAVSLVQEKQMTTQDGKNTHVYAIKGNFDDAQRGVKSIFSDRELAKKLSQSGVLLSSANSINIGRLVPQVAYYVYAYIKLLERKIIEFGEEINVVVPTGNFGNILASYYAKKMGIPIRGFICASNENKVLTDFFQTGKYNTNREFKVTNSPSMDILVSSNLERLIYHVYNDVYDDKTASEKVVELMDNLDKTGTFTIEPEVFKRLSEFYSGFATEDETLQTIKSLYNKHDYLSDTHTAVAYNVYYKYKIGCCDERETIIAATASPYKFPKSVGHALGITDEVDEFQIIRKIKEKTNISVPKSFTELESKPVNHKTVIEKEQMKEMVLELI
ncbi:threonine synthase [Eubacteriales bacterium KG127]